jgi:hypothetical protein
MNTPLQDRKTIWLLHTSSPTLASRNSTVFSHCEPVSARPKETFHGKGFLTGEDCATQNWASVQNSSLRSAVSGAHVPEVVSSRGYRAKIG